MQRGRKPTKSPKEPDHASAAPSLRTISQHAGVSITTVSRVLNGRPGRIAPATVERVQRLIEEVGYRPHQSGRSLRTRESSIIAALTSDPSNAYFSAIAGSIESAGRNDNHVMILANTMGDPQRQDERLLEMRSYLTRGIVHFGAVPSPGLQRFLEQGVPMVFIIRPCPLPIEAPLVGVDDYRAGTDVAEHFISQDYRTYGVILGIEASRASERRYLGFRDRMKDAGHEVAVGGRHIGGSMMESGYLQATTLLERKPPPRAIFCTTDMLAYGAFRRCTELGLRVPEDVVLFGFDDNPLNEWVAPWLSTVRTPYESFGPSVWEVFNTLWTDRGSDPPQIILPHHLVIRPEDRAPITRHDA
ncbi:LacI family transcriptional regulator [Acuticoccus sp. M5D2P5]|uniref:LacI family DNA-binding transcriptional regulator n=1 Tax=Acuticoccus kalidii TaxID=2910977 RepID=UPI001F33ADE1|nr:LacI family DNA-binding transcriptional regulator [Acuticoccus kalidii]MCF3933448.1 LacI family transcriptional regulator [Acuticoccus kalidii]